MIDGIVWKCHPDDLRTSQLTRVVAHFECMASNGGIRQEPLLNLLNGVRRKSDKQELWARVVEDISRILDGRSQIEAAVSSPGGDHLAVSLENEELARSEDAPGRFPVLDSGSGTSRQGRAGQT